MDYETAIGILRATADYVKEQEAKIIELKRIIRQQEIALVDLKNALR